MFQGFLHNFVLAKLVTSNIRVNVTNIHNYHYYNITCPIIESLMFLLNAKCMHLNSLTFSEVKEVVTVADGIGRSKLQVGADYVDICSLILSRIQQPITFQVISIISLSLQYCPNCPRTIEVHTSPTRATIIGGALKIDIQDW